MTLIKQAIEDIISNMSPAERSLVVAGDRSITRWVLRHYTPSCIATTYDNIPPNEIDAICWRVEVQLTNHTN
jgi:predicted nuclease of predicted toxin-antitoxin system